MDLYGDLSKGTPLTENVDNLGGGGVALARCGLDELREEVEPEGLGEADGRYEDEVDPPCSALLTAGREAFIRAAHSV